MRGRGKIVIDRTKGEIATLDRRKSHALSSIHPRNHERDFHRILLRSVTEAIFRPLLPLPLLLLPLPRILLLPPRPPRPPRRIRLRIPRPPQALRTNSGCLLYAGTSWGCRRRGPG